MKINSGKGVDVSKAYGEFIDDLSDEDLRGLALGDGVYAADLGGVTFELTVCGLGSEDDRVMQQAYGRLLLLSTAVDTAGCADWPITPEVLDAWEEGELPPDQKAEAADQARKILRESQPFVEETFDAWREAEVNQYA